MDSSWKKLASKNYSLSNELKNYISLRNADKWINQYANELSQFAYIFTDPNFQRDKLMFQNFLWHFNPKKRTVIWAADFHIVNDSLVNKGGIVPKLGAFLTQKFGSEYFKIGLIRNKDSSDMQAKRVIYPLPKNDKNYGKFDMLIKCKRGEAATLLTEE
jgi:erythromycin esterase-like protein